MLCTKDGSRRVSGDIGICSTIQGNGRRTLVAFRNLDCSDTLMHSAIIGHTACQPFCALGNMVFLRVASAAVNRIEFASLSAMKNRLY